MNSRAKGANGERELADKLRDLGFTDARRDASPGRPGHQAPDVTGIPGVHLEVKRVERLNIDKAMTQSIDDAAATGEIPAVVHRRNRRPWLVTIRLEDLMRLGELLQ